MKKIIVSGLGLLLATSVYAASPYDTVMVRSSQGELSAVSVANKAFYVKSFNVELINIGPKPVDLSKVCFKAYDDKGKEFKVDTIDEVFTTGILKAQGHIKSFIEFASEDDAVYNTQIVKLATDCD
ncbi:DUF4354 family protein [Entomomonas asaccharolytica]|uniref:DUF4354 family protein n=1 Tax=Entomomonas asaccharolytica TaxID=2785331 RepID=A0A974NI82_9GAMM|nr:DUF4354 family protein [Entomomonas asaccharolytica]QQP87042.1 DUF4354 family protein [Entomomonas asaccharolytica]